MPEQPSRQSCLGRSVQSAARAPAASPSSSRTPGTNAFSVGAGIWVCIKTGEPQNSRATSPFFPGILLFRKPSKTQGDSWSLKRTMVEKNGESTPRKMVASFWFPLKAVQKPKRTRARSETSSRGYHVCQASSEMRN